MSELTGKVVSLRYDGQVVVVTIKADDVNRYEYYIPDDTYSVVVKK